jgi:cytochrome c oxidase subunit 3
MATTIHEPPSSARRDRSGTGSPGKGGWHGLVPNDGTLVGVGDSSPASRTGIWVGLAAITMTFAAFTSALVVRQGASPDWRHFSLPGILYTNTLVLLASSVTLEIARRRAAGKARASRAVSSLPLLWLYLTLGLGLTFVAGQYIAWLKLRQEGLYLATNPSSSFFYVLTAAHALHILGGLGGLLLCISRLKRRPATLRRSTLDTTSYYWHFMDVLWIYLLVLLWIKL